MRHFFIHLAVIFAAATPVVAETFQVAGKRNAETIVGSYTSFFRESCKAADMADIRIHSQPANGVLTIRRTQYTFPKGHQCAGSVVPAVYYVYRPKNGFVGRDTMSVDESWTMYEERPPSFVTRTFEVTVQ